MGKKMEGRTWFTPRQEQLLDLASKQENFRTKFYLSGGTALSAVYLNHRESEDFEDIAANKLDTIFSRKTARDYVDIYSIVKSGKLSFQEIIQLHRIKFETEIDNLVIAKVLLQVTEAGDYPIMKVNFDKEKMIEFFQDEARKLGSKIFK
jgi:predicted nucleotidyltransferase component of viral defense system